MTETRVKISSILDSQLPQYVREEFPLVSEFLSQYYISLENKGGTSDILQNIDQYIKVDSLTNLIESTILTSDVSFFDSTINVESTLGFPDSYGLLLIDSEIITYTSKTSTSFEGCIRGFSGVTSFNGTKDELTFEETESQDHFVIVNEVNTQVNNLSILFLKEFLLKVKKQFIPGFDNRQLYSELNENIFIKQSKDFYSSKGTDRSFKILFGALYGENVEVIKPRDYLIEPSNAQYRITSDFVVESIEGNPEDLVNTTLYQDDLVVENKIFIEKSQGTITKVEKIRRGNKDYYQLSIDSDYDKDILPEGTIFGKFAIHPKTKIIISKSLGSTTLEVDSTVSFPSKNGNLVIDLSNGTSLKIKYESKTLNQFLGCSGIDQDIEKGTDVKLDAYAYGYGQNGLVKVRLLGVISDLVIPNNTKLYKKDSTIKISSLGSILKDEKSNNWFFNIPTRYNISSIHELDNSIRSYRFTTYDENSFKVGDFLTLTTPSGENIEGIVYYVSDKKTFNVKFGSSNPLLNVNSKYTIEKKLLKASFNNYSSVNEYTSNIQNVYIEGETGNLYVSSPSLPSYSDLNTGNPININVSDRSITFNGSFSPDNENDLSQGTTFDFGFNHGFYTGDSIVYKPESDENVLGISSGIYFVKKIDSTKIKLSRSKSNIFINNFVSTASTTVTNCKFYLTDFVYGDLSPQLLESQKLIRKISDPTNDNKIYETEPGLTGIFVNGVELLNYKSKNNIYYGPIQKIIPTSKGTGYDVINPPNLSISDAVGFGCSAHCNIIGNLERIDIIDPGFDYLEEPKISISGGNGFGAIAKANITSFDHEVFFNSQSSSGLVQLNPTNTIGFSSYHNFRDYEEVIYITDDQNAIGGISSNSTYFVSIQDSFTVKLHKSLSDSISGINTIQLSSYGTGVHFLRSKNKKNKVESITIENPGKNYQNNLTLTNSSGINTSTDTIKIVGHGYKSGEIITYNATENPIGGLSSSNSYYVTKIDDDTFKLSSIGISTLGFTSSYYYETGQYVNITNKGTGIHKFNYPDINVTISGKIGVSTSSNKDYNAVIRPVFRGEIDSVFIESGGLKYGSEDIINYNRQPIFTLNSGSGIELKPIVSNGKIVDILINSPGNGYNSLPDIIIRGEGSGAILTPIFSNGSLAEVKIINSGFGYKQNNTFLEIIPSGTGAKFESQIKSWRINLVDRLLKNNQIADDDGILNSGLNSEYGLQYTHAFAPRPLRSLVLGTILRNGEKIYSIDLQLNGNVESDSDAHSPIIGWSYDGNPIYGPYGYSTPTGGSIKSLKSGYAKNPKSNRPGGLSESIYPYGFFVDDYEYINSGDLDEYNGRFCITPEYPNGVYAYFTTIDQQATGTYKKPTFPYVIGNFYKSKPIDFNFASSSNQDLIDINETGWKRNTNPYNISEKNSFYDYILNPNFEEQQDSLVANTLKGSIDFIGIETGGNNYKVGDKILFGNSSSFDAKSEVSILKGKNVSQISVATSSFEDVEFYPYNKTFIGFTSIAHNYSNNDLITLTGKYDYKRSGTISVPQNTLVLTSGVSSTTYTGIVTYFNISGPLSYPSIRENDIYQIGNEQIKVLNVYPESSRIKVIRNQNNTIGESYSSGIVLRELSRKFYLNFGISTSYNFNVNKEFYFDPAESIAIGTSSGVGIVSTISFSNPGVGITQIIIPTQSIYIKNHNLNTGDSLIYSSNGGSQISVSTDGSSSFNLQENSIVYVAKLSKDLIGISTVRIGLGSTGSYVSSGSTSSILYFTSVGIGNTHSFKTNYENSLKGNIFKNKVTVSTAETHGLSLLDNVIIDINSGLSTSIIIKYNDYNRRLITNPQYFSFVDTSNNIINLPNHNLHNGQKVLHTSSASSSGLEDNKIYYVTTLDSNNIKLSNTYYDATKENPNNIDISSTSFGYISQINPTIRAIKNQTLVFDLSDSSLSFNNSGILYSAFELKFYEDENFNNEFISSKTSPSFEVVKSGRVGIDTNAKVTLRVTDRLPKNLYYKLIPINLDKNNPQIKKEINVDGELFADSKIVVENSVYSGSYSITGITSNTFSYNILDLPESFTYSSGVEYYTNSKTAKGPIHKTSILNGGKYSNIPGISTIISESGFGAILSPSSENIGKVTATDIKDIGYDFSSDYSIRPSLNLPQIIKLNPLSSLDYIGISSIGVNYTIAPTLVVIDSLTNEVLDVILDYNINDRNVSIIKNSQYINNISPKIIPTNNTNGFKINDINFNNTTKEVTVELKRSFSDPSDFPFEIGTKILVEGVSVGVGSTGRGYNSSQYNYELFTLVGVNTNLGGFGASVTYNISEYLKQNEFPGNFDADNSSGIIVPSTYFPIFDPVLKNNVFYIGEKIISDSSSGKIESYDTKNNIITVSTSDSFSNNQVIFGTSSKSVGIVKSINTFEVDSIINSSTSKRKGWNKETGFLNNNFQRIHDSNYYQYFSYDIKSKKDLNTWDDAVSALNHTAGFKKFANVILETSDFESGISTSQNKGDFSSIVDLSSVMNLNCIHDFDLARENNLSINLDTKSNQIIFNSRSIQDLIESVGNRVLLIDDISTQFNSNPRSTRFSTVDSFNLNDFRSKKYLINIQDKFYSHEQQLSIVSLLHDNSYGFINQYGLNTDQDLGFFDFNILGSEGNLTFYPVKPDYNSYYIELFSFNINDIITGIGSTSLGDSVSIFTQTSTIPQSTTSPTTIVGISTAYRSAKVLVQIGSSVSSYYEYDEIIYIHDNNEVFMVDYGQITTGNYGPYSSSGIGTYNAYISGNEVKIDLIPYTSTNSDYDVNTINVSLNNSNYTGIGTQVLGGSSIESSSIAISSSPSPVSTIISRSENTNYTSQYSIISIEDKTNLEYQISELLVITTFNVSIGQTNTYITQYGDIKTGSEVGIITAGVSGTETLIYFTPKPNIDIDVKVFTTSIGLEAENSKISLVNGSLNYDYGTYESRFANVKKSFELKHKGLPIFKREFDGGSSNFINLNDNTIKIQNHFYTTGEEIEYLPPGGNTSNSIGISTVTISGLGSTDKLPSTLYVVKIDDLNIRVSASASEALKTNPDVLQLTSVGLGTVHTFVSKNQNKKLVLTIDNVIQSPIISLAQTSSLTKNVGIFDGEVYVSSIDSIFSGDFIKINDEIMKVNSVGVGSTNSINVFRQWFGTGISTHNSSDLIQKVSGNYNIIENTINFSDSPYGLVPVTNVVEPDEVSYVGISTGSSFSGRVFLRNGIPDSTSETYSTNYIFDDISDQFNGLDNSFTLKSNNNNIVGISSDNAILLINEIFQGPDILNEYNLNESSGITTATFIGIGASTDYDVNLASIPRGGIIVSIGSTFGFGYQPLVSAGGTAIVSAAGTIQSISIGNSGSGYRSGIQTTVNVSVATSSLGIPNIEVVGIASIVDGKVVGVSITNPGIGYTSSNPPLVIFDDPLSYSNIPLIYSSQSTLGVGTGASIDIVVGQGSSVISFEIKNYGYAYKNNEILTIPSGGISGIPTDSSSSFSEFQIIIEKTYSDKFSGWTIGNLQVIDSVDSLFDGVRRFFPIKIGGDQFSIKSRRGSNIDIQSTFLVFINDVLQVPGKGYIFNGGSIIEFTEAPKVGDKSKLLFYKGTGEVDTVLVDIYETIKKGDTVTLESDDFSLLEDERIGVDIISSDVLETNLYSGPGLSQNESLLRPLKWCKQTEDLFIDGENVTKDRLSYEPNIQPVSNLISNVGYATTILYVESVKTFFDSEKENASNQNKILIISQDSIVGASATALVSIDGTISSIIINDGGAGYSTSPIVTISNPIGFGTTQRSEALSTISVGGTVSSIIITSPGTGYTFTNPPQVFIEPPKTSYEINATNSYTGDFGIIVGFGTTTISSQNKFIFDLYIPQNSFLRDTSIVSSEVSVSSLSAGDYFVVNESNIGSSTTSILSLKTTGEVIGIGTQFIDNVYQVSSSFIVEVNLVGVGTTYVRRVFADIGNYSSDSFSSTLISFDSTSYTFDSSTYVVYSGGISTSNYFGSYSWGKILLSSRNDAKNFNSYTLNGTGGISTSALVRRIKPLKYEDYNL